MPRIRTIKPEFWTDEKIVELSCWARLLYIGLWNFADDNGVLEYKPKQIKLRIFPADNVDIEQLLSELEKNSLINIYFLGEAKYLICPNLAKHQVIDTPRKSNLPLPENYEIKRNKLKSTEILLGRGRGRGKEKEKEGNYITPKKSKSQKIIKTKIPEDFDISPEVKTWALKNGHVHLDKHLEAFKDLVHSNGYTYINWDSAFKRAIREDWGKIVNSTKQTEDNCDQWLKARS